MSNRPQSRLKTAPKQAIHAQSILAVILSGVGRVTGAPSDRSSLLGWFGAQRSRRTCGCSLRQCKIASKPVVLWTLTMCLAVPIPVLAQPPQPAPVVLDRVVAVVNNQAILASDLDDEIRLSVLDPADVGLGVLTRKRALEQLISRALIQQQIREEDAQAADPPKADVDARLAELRRELPICVRQNCATEAGWKAFLAAHDLAQERVEVYLRYRLQILRFIEQRFQQGIRISPEQIEAYYRGTLLPQYSPGESIPPLDQVTKRIEEILLQQQVNVLFDGWLGNLRKQGDVEVLDPALETPEPGTAVPGDAQRAPISSPLLHSGQGRGSL